MKHSLSQKLFLTVTGIFLLLLFVQGALIGKYFDKVYLGGIMDLNQSELAKAVSHFSGGDESSVDKHLRQYALDTGSCILVLKSDHSFGDRQFIDRMGSVPLCLETGNIHILTVSFGSYPDQPVFFSEKPIQITAAQLGKSSYYEPFIITHNGNSYTNLASVHDLKNRPGQDSALHELYDTGVVFSAQHSAFSVTEHSDANFFLYQRMLPCLVYRLPIEDTLSGLTNRLIADGDATYAVYSESRTISDEVYHFITARQVVMTGREQIYFNRMFHFFYAMLVSLLIVAAWLLSRYLSKPLVHLSDITRQLAHQDFSCRAVVNRKDELGLLADNINHMAASLSGALTDLHAINKRSCDNEARMQRLLADLAHEFKTPLFVISSHIEALETGIVSGNTEKYYTLIGGEIEHLTDLVNEVIELSHIQMGTWHVNIGVWELHDIIQATIEKFENRFAEGSYTLNWSANEAMVLMDPRRIEQVLTNFLSNAFKYSNSKKQIELYTQTDERFVTVWVCNSGELSAVDRERIWERYYKSDSTQLSLLPSDGIGLDIVTTILRAHNSRYGVVQDGGMVRFYFTLELSKNP